MRAATCGAALIVVALLCGCGGGGGGASSSAGVTPVTPTASPAASPTPAATQTPTPPMAIITLGSSSQTATLTSSTGNVTSASVIVPGTTSGTSTLGLSLSATLPANAVAVAAATRKTRAIGGTLAPIAYITLTSAATISFASSLALSFTLASGQTIPAGTTSYVGFYDPTNTALGWTTYLATSTASGQTVAFGATAQPLTLQANVAYVVALFSTTQALAPATAATSFPGGATLAAALTTPIQALGVPLPPAARSAVFTFTPAGGGVSTSNLVAVPASCSCTLTLPAPVGTNQTVTIREFASSNGSGNALAYGTASANFYAGQSTASIIALYGIVGSYTASASPASLQIGIASYVAISETPYDAAGEPLYGAFYTSALTLPGYTIAPIDPSGLFSGMDYNGIGSEAPVAFSVQLPGYPAALTSPLPFMPVTTTAVGFGVASNDAFPTTGQVSAVYIYPSATTTTPSRYFTGCATCTGHPRYDASGTLWGAATVGIKPDATAAGTFAPPGSLLAFDASGHAYVADTTNRVIVEYASATSTAIVRQINVPGSIGSVAIDNAGDVYAGISTGATGVYEYGPTGSGTVTPIAVNASASDPTIDGSGNVYAVTSVGSSVTTVGEWSAGTFGASAPARTISLTLPANTIASAGYAALDLGADAAGDLYLSDQLLYGSLNNAAGHVYYAAAGASTFSANGFTTPASGAEGANFIILPFH